MPSPYAAKEERKDWTEVNGESAWTSAYEAPAGWKIVDVRPRSSSEYRANITGHGKQVYNRPAGEVVSEFEVYGDRDGDEAGTWSRVDIHWRVLAVSLQETEPEWAR